MTDALVVVALGFFLGMRHATDADHVVAVTTIVSRERDLRMATLTGFLWGVGHSLTVVAVGAAIVLFNLTIANRVSLGMELSVAAMLVMLGLLNITAFLNFRPSGLAAAGGEVGAGARPRAQSWGLRAHTSARPCARGASASPRSHAGGVARSPLRPVAAVSYARPVVVGMVHGLAGSAAVTLLVVAVVRDPNGRLPTWWSSVSARLPA